MKTSVHPSWFLVIPALCLMIYGYYVVRKKNYVSPVSYIVKDGKLTKTMQNLLKLSYIEYDGSFQDAVKATQKLWLRPVGVQRWEMDSATYANRREIWDAFEKLHIVQRVEPVGKPLWSFYKLYDYMIVLGDAYDGIKTKMQYIEKLYENGVNCGPIIFLASDRPLDQAYEIEFMMHDFEISAEQCPKTESEMIKFMVEKRLPSK